MLCHSFRGMVVALAMLFATVLPAASADAQAVTAGAFNIKLLNNNQPDFSDARSFARSCSYGWKSDQDKAISMWKWTCLNRVQTDVTISEIYEKGLKPNYYGSDYFYQSEWDFVTYLNSVPNQFCGFVCPGFGAAWNLYTGQFWCTNNIVFHTTVDIWYDGQPHMFDTSLNNYVLNDKGVVAGTRELQENYKKHGGQWWASDNCPMRRGDSLDCLLEYEPRTLKELGSKYDSVGQSRGGGEAINQTALAVRPYTSYKRHKNPIAPTDENYFIPSRGDGDKQSYEGGGGGKFPNSYWGNNRSVTNGLWAIAPDLSKPDWSECAYLVANVVQGKSPRIHPKAAGQDAEIVFNITPYNSVAHMQIAAKAVKGDGDTLEALISFDTGRTWKVLEPAISGEFKKTYRAEVLAKKAYLLKLRMKAASAATSVGLQTLEIRVVTQVNRLSLFQLDRGSNKVYINVGEQLDRVELRPDYRPEYIMQGMYESSNMKAGAGPLRNNAQLKTQGQEGYAVYRIDAPGDIKHVTMAGIFGVWDANCPMSLHYSTDMGKTWTKFDDGDIPISDAFIGEKGPKSPEDVGNAQYAQKFCKATIAADGVKTVLFKLQLSPKASPKAYANGIWRLWMAADYRVTAFRPFEVTLSWQEFRRDGTTPVRTYKKTVTKPEPWTVLDVNVAGYRPPLMKYVTVSAVGSNPDVVKEGYGDGVDVGAGDEPLKYVYTMKKNLAKGRPVSASVKPIDKGTDPARLVDEEVTHNFFKTGARFAKGANPEITITLDGVQEVQGVSVYQNVDANAKGETASAYAESIDVSVSTDGVKWNKVGTLTKYDLYNWPGDYLPLNFEAMHFANLFLGGLTHYNAPLAFEKPVQAKLVKFSVTNPQNNWASTELRVWGEMKKTKWEHDNFEHDKMR